MNWFYRYQGTEYGPLEFDDLKLLVSHGRVRRDTPVWQEGMVDWSVAAQVEGLFAQPPPYRRPAPQAAAPGRVASASAEKPLKGIDGWLILFAFELIIRTLILIVLTPVVLLATLANGMAYAPEGITLMPLLAGGWVLVTVGFFRRRHWVPGAYITLTIVGGLYLLYLLAAAEEFSSFTMLFAVALGFVVVSYWASSKRVKNTFVEGRREYWEFIQ